MPGWLQWTLVGGVAWCVIATVTGFALARALAFVSRAPAVEPAPDRFVTTGSQSRVLVVDDDDAQRLLLRATLSSDEFDVREVASAEQARELLRSWRPDVVLLDVHLPGTDGLTFCAELRTDAVYEDTAVVLLTGEDISGTTARLAGARALLRKPFSPLELLRLLNRLGEEREFVAGATVEGDEQLLLYARDLASIARAERTQRQLVQDAYRQTATALADAVEARDRGTALHAQRVQQYASKLAEAIEPALLQDPSVEYGFLLHDVGKIGIPDDVLLKPGPLTAGEVELVRSHPSIGAQILRGVAMLRDAGLDVVRHHHERWDGAGYPDGLAREQIPLSARIFAVADTLDAMTTDRPYRTALSWDDAVDEIVAQGGRQFDPAVVRAFVAQHDDLHAIYEDVSLVA